MPICADYVSDIFALKRHHRIGVTMEHIKFEDLVKELTKLESLPLPKPSIEDLKVMNDHLKMAANKMEKTPGSAVATSKWKPNGFDSKMNPDAQEFRPTFGRPKIDKKKMKSSPHLKNVWNLHRF